MVAKLGGPQGCLGSFLVAYLVLLLFCFSVSISEGGWLYVGLISLVCFVVAFFGWFVRFSYRYHRKGLYDVSLDKWALPGRRSQER